MSGVALFASAQLLVTLYAGIRGGAPERLVGAMLCIAFLAVLLVPYDPYSAYRHVRWPIAMIDGLLLMALLPIALLADRYWPMWIAACQTVAIGVHVVRGFDPTVWMTAYWALSSRLGYLMLAMLVIGTARHQSRLRADMPEFAWSAQRHAHERAEAAGRRDNR